MAYPCFICGSETGPECLCLDCRENFRRIIHNGDWCQKHQIIHWKATECPLCSAAAEIKKIKGLIKKKKRKHQPAPVGRGHLINGYDEPV